MKLNNMTKKQHFADRIIVMNEEGIAEQGKHDELVAQGGVYSRLNAMQPVWSPDEGLMGSSYHFKVLMIKKLSILSF